MIKIFLCLALSLGINLTENDSNNINSAQGLLFENTTIDAGENLSNDNDAGVKFEFSYINKSKKSIYITDVKRSCGCTTVKYNEKEIKKGEKGVVEVIYNYIHKNGSGEITGRVIGPFQKIISLPTVNTSESKEEIVLTIKGVVKAY